MTLAEKLTQARKAAGLTQADSAEKLNVSRQAVSLWESGQSRPSTDKLSALAKIYTVSLDWLCSGTDEPVPDKPTAYTCPELEPAEQAKQWKKSIAKWAAIVLALFALIAAFSYGRTLEAKTIAFRSTIFKGGWWSRTQRQNLI